MPHQTPFPGEVTLTSALPAEVDKAEEHEVQSERGTAECHALKKLVIKESMSQFGTKHPNP